MISASLWGKLKTAVQVAMVICVIAVHGHPLWLWLLIYVTVVVTVLSGADYFFGLRRGFGARAPAGRSGNLIQPRPAARVDWAPAARPSSCRTSPSVPKRSATTLC